jgi:Ca2+-binding EF-hand superfamily protein
MQEKEPVMIGSIGSSNAISQWSSSLFSKLDTKNQGYIEKSDLQSAIEGLSSTESTSGTASVDDVFSTLDTDGDGKVTQSEMSTSLQNLLDELQSQFSGARMGGSGGPGGMGGMPPPPPPEGEDEGFTQEELTAMAEEIGSGDSKRSSLMSSIAANFEEADSDGNGKVNREEAMAFEQTLQAASASSTESTSESASTSQNKNAEALVMLRIMQLMQTYGAFEQDGASSSTTSALVAEA